MNVKKNIYKKSVWDLIRSALLPILFTVVVMGMIVFGLRQTEESSKSEGMRILDESIRRAIVINYAIEGSYPESIAYLEDNYGIHIDRSKYVVHYSIFASNIMPDMSVIDYTGDR